MKNYPISSILLLIAIVTVLFFPVILLVAIIVPWFYKYIIKCERDLPGKVSSPYSNGKSYKRSSTLSPTFTRMDTAEYHSYLQSPEWKTKVSLIKQRDKVCQLTGATTQLEVHHITYDRLGNEDLSDLVLLSRSAHQHVHDYYGSYSRSNTYPINNLRN